MSIGVVCLALLAGSYLALNETDFIFGVRMSNRPLTFGSLMAFFALLAGVSDPFRKLAEVYNSIQRAAVAADRVYALADRQPHIASAPNPRSLPLPLARLSFDKISFHYLANCPVLNDIEFEIEAGETLAIVGPNGCGKSSLISLIPRFYDPTAGAVRWNGVDLRELPLKALRQRIGLVSQQAMLFDETVFDNIRYGSPQASNDQVVAAARKAHAHKFIEEVLPQGYQTVVGPSGKRLSGGQRQRIVLARAILRDPEILLLDEATSQIDVESEQLIHKTLSQFVRGRTTVMITHRLASLCLANRILVLDTGRIVDLGTHQELINRCHVYERLHEIQFRASA
jgi:ATP-binding cassette subfamily B protein/subfamily B ATP-binding cassette protein MsbA